MPTGANDAGQVVAGVEAAGVNRRSAVSQQQRAGLAFSLGLCDRLIELNPALRPQADMAVRVHQPGQDPAAVENRLGAADRFAADPALDYPQFNGFFVGQPHPSNVLRHYLLPGKFSFDKSKLARPGGSSSRPCGMFDRSGNPAGMPAPSGPRTLGGVGPRFLPFLPLPFAFFRVADFRPNPGIPMLLTIEDIILRASKKRSTS